MEKEFVTYEIALALKELGFDEECFNVYDELGFIQDEKEMDKLNLIKLNAPLWQQAFNWIFKQLDFYYPFIRLEIYSDASGGWYAPSDDDSNEYWNTSFSSLEEAINQVLDLILKSK